MVSGAGLQMDRVVEVIVGLPDGGRRGSGYLVAAGRVLTAAHVVADAIDVRVRFDADRPGEQAVEAAVDWRQSEIDVAVLRIPESGGPDSEVEPADFGGVGEHDVVLRCSVLGFPRFKLRTDRDGTRYRDSEHVHATCAVLSNRREGTLDLRVPPPADGDEPDISPWEGMSGAVVLSRGLVVGVVVKHHRSDGPGRLAAGRVDRWAESLSAEELRGLESALGCRLAPADLPDALPPSRLGLIGAAYGAQLRDLAPVHLEGRDDELRRLVEFCDGTEPYLWLQAPPWAGKTALAAWLALHPPHGVVPVWFFITSRLAGQSDSVAYGEAVTNQLAAIAGREPTRPASPYVRDGERRVLLHKAAERVARDGGTLLLIVDGLDEDQSVPPDGKGPSIASLLPERPPPNLRVLVTSRSHPGVPSDVKSDHPLRGCTVSTLRTVPAARHSEHEAEYDLTRVLSGDDLGRDLVGLLAAARGELTSADLGTLTGARHAVVRQRLSGAFGRILQERGGGSEADDGQVRGYVFAHETLYARALTEFGPDMRHYHERIHRWADRHAAAGWPPDTPPYLLTPYGYMVASLGDLDRSVALATDVRRRDRMREATGSDTAGYDEIDVVRGLVFDTAPDDLCHLAALSAAADLVARRNLWLPPRLPIALARMGQIDHAVGLALSVFRVVDRAEALAGIAQVLAETGDSAAGAVARAALRHVETANEHAFDFMPNTDESVLIAAVALTTAGRRSEALAALEPVLAEDPLFSVRARAAVAAAAFPHDPETAAGLLAQAAKTAGKISSPVKKIQALTALAEAYKVTDPGRASRTYKRLARLADKDEEPPSSVLTAAATALEKALPEKAAHFAERAVDLAESLLISEIGLWEDFAAGLPPQHQLTEAAADAVRALVIAGRADEAQYLAESTESQTKRSFVGWEAVAMGWARAGRADKAWQAWEKDWDGARELLWLGADLRPEGAGAVAAALAEAGSTREAESVVLAAADRYPWAAAEALAVLGGHHAAQDPEEAARLVRAAENVVARSNRESADPDRDERFASVAIGLAAIGRFSDAERLISVIGNTGWRAQAFAGVSVAHSKAGSPHAPRLAQTAADLADDCKGSAWQREAMSSAAHALARVGMTDRALALANPDLPPHSTLFELARGTARLAVAAGLWSHDPAVAASMLDEEEHRIRTGHDGAEDAVSGFVHLLVAVDQRDPERSRHLLRAARYADDVADTYGVESVLLTAGTDLAEALRQLSDLDADLQEDSDSSSSTLGPFAIAQAALGDVPSAVLTANRITDSYERAEVLCALAAYCGRAKGGPMTTCLNGDSRDQLDLVRRLAAQVTPPNDPNSAQYARELLAGALLTDGWHHAIPILVGLEPDALTHIRDIVFKLLELHD
jgi:tetratricopeptide (TPR) repeat protein